MLTKKVPVIHQTDCFHHHADPDDHWDLASQFALAYTEDIDLKGILIDYPPTANTPGAHPVFDFMPIDVTCDDDGKVSWVPHESQQRFIFRILDPSQYEAAMTKALRELLSCIP